MHIKHETYRLNPLPWKVVVRSLLGLFSKREKLVTLGILLLMVFGAALELLGISLIIPLVQMIANPSILQTQSGLAKVYKFSGINSERQFFLWASILVMATFVFKGLYFSVVYYLQNSFLGKKRTALASDLFASYLKAPYSFHLGHHSAELYRNVAMITKIVDSLWTPLSVFISEILVVVCVLTFLFFIQPFVTLAALFILGGAGFVFLRFVRGRISRWALMQFHQTALATKWLHQGLKGLKEIRILGAEKHFYTNYAYHLNQLTEGTVSSATMAQTPRLFLEALLAVGIISFILFTTFGKQNNSELIPLLVMFAVAAVRLMPSMTRILSSLMMIKEGWVTAGLIHLGIKELQEEAKSENKDLQGPIPIPPFSKSINFHEVTHRYSADRELAVDHLNLTINRNETVAFVGQSGAGKTTLVDILIGLIPPSEGRISVDGISIFDNVRSWYSNLGYVPQQIYLTDESIKKNIALGVPEEKISDSQIWNALELAQLSDFVRTLPDGVNTLIGENGTKLSGGQKQRLGIARALYKDPNVLIMDEAMSALDNETEREVMGALKNLKGQKTIILVSHRLGMLSHCDRVFFMKKGRLVASGKYQELLSSNNEFAQFASI